MQRETQESDRRKAAERSIGNGMNTTAAIYLRRSTEDNGKSVTQQERDLRTKADQLGVDVVVVYREDDGTSASSVTNQNRPQFERCLDDYQAGIFNTIMVWEIDRWSRKGAAEIGQLLDLLAKHNGRLIDTSFDTQSTGLEAARIPLLMKAEMARTETVNMQKRILRGKEQQRIQGTWLGGQVPFGLARVNIVDGVVVPSYLVVDPQAAKVIKDVADWVIKGSSITEACDKLNEQGITTSTGSAWRHQTLRRLMRSPHLIGQRLYRDTSNGKEDVARDEDGNPLIVTDPILDESTFRRVDEVLKSRRQSNRKTRKGNGGGTGFSLLSGLMRCAKCSASMVHDKPSPHPTQKRSSYYCCPVCKPRNAVPSHLVEAYLSNQVLQIVEAQQDDSPIASEIGKRWSEQYAASDVAHRNELQDQADDIESRLGKLRKDHYVKAVISDDDFEDMEYDLLGKLAPIEASLALMPEITHGTSFLADLIQLGGDHSDPLGPDTGWSKLDHHVKRSIIRCVIDNVIVEAGEKGKPGENIEGRCEISVVKPEEATAAATRPDRVANPAVNRKAKLANA